MTIEDIKENSILNNTESLSIMKESSISENLDDKALSTVDDAAEAEVTQRSSREFSLEDIKEFISAGTQAFALSNFEDAAEKLSIALEAQVNHLGPLSVSVASTYYLYGCALFQSAVQKSSVLGEKADQVKPASLEAGSSACIFDLNIGTGETQNFVFADIEEGLSEDEEEAQNLQDIEVPTSDDLELAWENLDCARVILEKQDKSEFGLQLADVHVTLGDVSLESENFDEAVKDYEIALNMKTELVPENFRELAEVHFKLSLALEYSEQNEAAIGEVQSAMAMIKKRIELLGLKSKGKEASASENDSTSVEIKELEGFLSDLTSKMADIKALLDKEDRGESITAIQAENFTKPPVVPLDISKLVKKRKSDRPDSSSLDKKIKSNQA